MVLGIFFGSKISGKLYTMKQEAKDFETEIGGREDRILALVTEKRTVTTGDAAKLLGLSHPTARRILDKLEKDGKIKQEGVGRGVRGGGLGPWPRPYPAVFFPRVGGTKASPV